MAAPRLPPMDTEALAAREWLGGEHGGMVLRADIIEIMMEGFPEYWSMDDVARLDGMTWASAKQLWAAYFADSCLEAGEEETKSLTARWCAWMQAHFEAGDGGDVTSNYIPSKDEVEDLEAQGMTSRLELRHFELSMLLGRVSGDAEIEGGDYGVPATMMVGGKPALKGTARSLDRIVEGALKAAKPTLGLVEAHVQGTVTALSRHNDPTRQRQATRLLQWWTITKRRLGAPERVLAYVVLYRRTFVGRGLPVEYDTGLAADVLAEPMEQQMAVKAQSSPSKEISDLAEAMKDQMKELLAANQTLVSQVSSLGAKVGRLEQKSKADTTAGKNKFGRKCIRCGSKDHLIADCQEPEEDDP